VPAGTTIELRLDDESTVRVAGRVLSRSGAPLADVKVTPARAWSRDLTFERPLESWKASPMVPPSLGHLMNEAVTLTDKDGRFVFPALATEDTTFHLSGDSILLGANYSLSEAADLEEIAITVDALCRVRVVCDDPDTLDAFTHVDESDSPLPLFVRVDSLTISTPRVDVIEGRSGIALFEEGKRTLVFHKGDKIVGRKTVTLEPGGVVEVRP